VTFTAYGGLVNYGVMMRDGIRKYSGGQLNYGRLLMS